MPEQQNANNSLTYVVGADDFEFETLEQENGQATVIRFKLSDPRYHAGTFCSFSQARTYTFTA